MMKRNRVASLVAGTVIAVIATGAVLALAQSDPLASTGEVPTIPKLDCPVGDPISSEEVLYAPTDGSVSAEEGLASYLRSARLSDVEVAAFESVTNDASAESSGVRFMTLTDAGQAVAIAQLERDAAGSWLVTGFTACGHP